MFKYEFEGVNRIDGEVLATSISTAPAFPHFCLDNFFTEEFAQSIHDEFPSFDDALKVGRSFSAVNEHRKVQVTDASLFPPSIAKLNTLLASDGFLKFVSDMTGIPHLLADPDLAGGGIHETNGGGHLDVHVDFNYNDKSGLHRRVNILFYFNKDWKEEYGGILDLWNADVSECVGQYLPLFNRAVGFVTGETSWHGVTPLTCPPSTIRKSFAVYYYTRDAPAGWDGSVHSTIFKARPDEYWKGQFAMPVENALRSVLRGKNALRQSVKNILKL